MMDTRILLVDDEESLRLTLGANLELEGFEVIEAASAEEALERVSRGEEFDLILSDVRMPGRSGVELFHELARVRPNLPVVLMTAFSTEAEIRRAIEAGVFAVLAKPFNLQRTVATLQSAMRKPMVLVVDDVESIASTTAESIRAMGVRATAVFDGASAVEAIESGSIDVCVTDLAMPGMDGLELANRARALHPDLLVIVFSGAPRSDALMQQAAEEGAYRCIRKPLDPVKLVHTIASARSGK